MTFSFLNILLLLGLGIAVAALLAPLEALFLWAGWRSSEETEAFEKLEPVPYGGTSPEQFIVFLDGISKGSYRDLDNISDFLAALTKTLPKACIIHDILPYSVFNMSVTDKDYPLSRFWTWIEKRKLAGNPIGFLINIRNLFQIIVSADWRYGLIYNLSMAKLILRHLLQHGYKPDSHMPIYVIGYSGGGQVAAGTASLIGQALDAPVTVISIAGVMAGSTDLRHVKKWYQVISNKDPVERMGAIMFPLRWRVVWFSRWNKAKRQGKAKLLHLDGARHNLKGSYMDKDALTSSGQPQLERTVELIRSIIL